MQKSTLDLDVLKIWKLVQEWIGNSGSHLNSSKTILQYPTILEYLSLPELLWNTNILYALFVQKRFKLKLNFLYFSA